MKTKLIACMLLLGICSLGAQNKLTIVVDGIETIKGQMMVALYDEANFLQKPINGTFGKITKEEMTFEMENIPSGTYAVSLFQDEDENYKLNTGPYGMPTEKYAFSNNTRSERGTPPFKDCQFTIKEDATIYITLQ